MFDPKNADMHAAWNGSEGKRWTADADCYEQCSPGFDRRMFSAARIGATDVVLDIGCGSGASARAAARAATKAQVLGVDLSEPLVALARERARAEKIDNVAFEHGDAQIFPFAEGSFDVVISSFGCMFFGDPIAAYTNIARAMKPGGRVALNAWRSIADNEWVHAIREVLAAGRTLPARPPNTPGPFSFADKDFAHDVLTKSGFDRVELRPIDDDVVLGTDVDHAFAFVRRMGLSVSLLDGLDAEKKEGALTELRALLAKKQGPKGVALGGGAWSIVAVRS